MSYFGTALQIVLQRREMSQRAAAETAGVDSGNFSRYVAGTIRPNRDALEKICSAFLAREDRADLVVAHLRDEVPQSASDLVRIINLVEAGDSRVKEEAAKRGYKLSPQAVEIFDFWMERAEKSPSVVDWLGSTRDIVEGR